MFGSKSIHNAADKGSFEKLKKFIEKHPDAINNRNQNESTALMFAAGGGHADKVELLINKGAKIDCVNKHQCSALILASHYGHYDCVKLLLEAGADITIPGRNGETAEQKAKTPAVRQLFKDHKKKLEQADQTERQADSITDTAAEIECGVFLKESQHQVSITDELQASKIQLRTIYNFKARTVTYMQCTPQACPNVVRFYDAADQQQIEDAADYLTNNDGDIHGWEKPLAF